MAEPPLIDIRNATIWRGETRVFDDLTLTIERHERVAILGPNGSGKTTLLKTINRELYPVQRDGSWVRILGRERWNVWELRRHIGIVSHDLQQRYRPTTTALEVATGSPKAQIVMLRSFVVERATKHLSVGPTERFFGRSPTTARPQNDGTERLKVAGDPERVGHSARSG